MVYGHVMREEEHAVRRVMTKEITEERETEDKIEGCVQTRHADCGTESGRGRRRGVLESEDLQPYRQPQMTATAREEEDEEPTEARPRIFQTSTVPYYHNPSYI